MSYFVVGGIYKDTSFSKLKEGLSEEKFGPYKTYDEAMKMWEKVSWDKVDDCYARYIILPQK